VNVSGKLLQGMRRLKGGLQLGRQLGHAAQHRPLGQARQCHGHALKVLGKETEESAAFELDLTSLRDVFCCPRVAELPACVLSVAGAMRTGKSFLLDQMVRSLAPSSGAGFSWRGGMSRHTSGIHICAQPLIVERNGEQLAVFLMDTQGTFDYRTTVRENMTVFALSTMTSSVLVYNVQHGIREDHLQHLQLFTEYGRMALRQTGTKPFQKLQFLVRDWHYPHDAAFGGEGGELVLQRLLAADEDQPLEVRALREHLTSCFTSTACWLLPYPGPAVSEDPNFKGTKEEMDPRFAKHLGEFIAGSLSPENLEAKQIAGKAVKSHEMVDFFQRYLEIFNGDEIPEPKSIFNTTAEVTNLHALNSSREAYVERMEGLKLSATSDAIIDTDLAKRHQENLSHSLQLFQEQSKFGGAEFAAQYQEALLKEIQEKFDYFQKLNDSKIQNLFYQAKEGYLVRMEAECGTGSPLHHQKLGDLHIECAQEAAGLFHQLSIDGTQQALSRRMLDKLVSELESRFLHYQSVNESRIRLAVYRAVDSALDSYSRTVEEIMEGPLSTSPTKLLCEHMEAKRSALEAFNTSSSYGTNFVSTNSKSLERDIDEKFAYYRELNESKKLGKRLKATMEQLSDNQMYRQFWRSKDQQRIAGGGVALLILLKLLAGS